MNIKEYISQYKSHITNKILKLNRCTKIRILSGVIGCVLLSSAFVMMSGAEVYSLAIAGKDAGYIADKSLVEEAIKGIKADYSSSKDGSDLLIDQEEISLKKTDLQKDEIKALTAKELEEKIIASKICKVNGWTINVDGKNLVSAATKKDANKILADVKNHYLTNGSQVISADFKENVSLTKAAVNITDIMKSEDAVNLIITGEKAPKIYTVKDGDTLWDIAVGNATSPAELQNTNPGFDQSQNRRCLWIKRC